MSPPATCSLTPSRWAGLPPDLLGSVSDRLHDDAADFVRLHAVCTSWRDALLSLTMTTTAFCPPFHPHLITPCEGLIMRTAFSFGRVSAGTTCISSYRQACDGILFAEPTGRSSSGRGDMNWVASADGMAVWTFTDAGLLNLLTGGVTPLPRLVESGFHWRMNKSFDIVYGDSTVFLHNITYELARWPTFRAAILNPGDAAWTYVKFIPRVNSFVTGSPTAAYHRGKIIVLSGGVHYSCDLTELDYGCGSSELEARLEKIEYMKFMHNYSYVLKFGDELLWVSVIVQIDYPWCHVDNNVVGDHLAHALSLMVHSLEEEVDDSGKMRWIEKDGRILGDHVLFLGFPASFAVDGQLDMDGGCAYFVINRCVFKYNFMDDEAKLLKRLRPVSHTDMTCLWLRPQPVIAPIQEIRKRLEVPKKKKQ